MWELRRQPFSKASPLHIAFYMFPLMYVTIPFAPSGLGIQLGQADRRPSHNIYKQLSRLKQRQAPTELAGTLERVNRSYANPGCLRHPTRLSVASNSTRNPRHQPQRPLWMHWRGSLAWVAVTWCTGPPTAYMLNSRVK